MTNVEQIVLTFITRQPDCSRHKIAYELHITLVQCQNAIRNLEKTGRIERKEDWNCIQ